MELEEKYLVFKRADIEAALSEMEEKALRRFASRIAAHRRAQGKSLNEYVVINRDEPYFPDVLALMEKANG